MSCDVLESERAGSSPFSRGIVVDWYDGAVAGAAECTTGSHAAIFASRMVAWDVEEENRIFLLRRLPDTGIADLTLILSDAGEPRWPWWIPMRFSTPELRDAVWDQATAFLDSAGPVEYAIASPDLMNSVQRIRKIEDDTIREQINSMIRSAVDDPDDFVSSDASYEEWSTVLWPPRVSSPS